MGWARLDDGFHDHPKLIGLPLDAVGLYTLALTWAHRHKGASSGLMGHIPADLPTRLAGSKGKALAAKLEAHQLWDSEPGLGGWVIHDFCDYLPAADKPSTAAEVSAARSEAGRHGARARWGDKSKASDRPVDRQADSKLPSDLDGKPMPPTRPDPTQEKNTPSSAVADAAFAAFWSAYPRKVGKDAARKVWARRVRSTAADEITAGAARMAADPNLPEKEFIPHPATWLTRGGWDDEAFPARSEQQPRWAQPASEQAEYWGEGA